jgi:hypothetical protein
MCQVKTRAPGIPKQELPASNLNDAVIGDRCKPDCAPKFSTTLFLLAIETLEPSSFASQRAMQSACPAWWLAVNTAAALCLA